MSFSRSHPLPLRPSQVDARSLFGRWVVALVAAAVGQCDEDGFSHILVCGSRAPLCAVDLCPASAVDCIDVTEQYHKTHIPS